MPLRDEGFFRAFATIYGQPCALPDRWAGGLAAELRRMIDEHVLPLESIAESLDLLGVRPDEWEQFISTTLLALRGWGGMVHQIELRGDRAVHPIPESSLVDFLAIRLLLDRLAFAYVVAKKWAMLGRSRGCERPSMRRSIYTDIRRSNNSRVPRVSTGASRRPVG